MHTNLGKVYFMKRRRDWVFNNQDALRNTRKGSMKDWELIERARNEIGYSKFTYHGDIAHSVYNTLRDIVREEHEQHEQ